MSTRVCAVDEIPDCGAIRRDVAGHRLALVRIGSDVYAIGDRCTHMDIALSEGEVDPDDLTIECWKHGSCFSLTDGEPTSLPAVRPVPTYPVSIVDGDVHIELVDS